jgi:hypothetical protein
MTAPASTPLTNPASAPHPANPSDRDDPGGSALVSTSPVAAIRARAASTRSRGSAGGMIFPLLIRRLNTVGRVGR